MVEPQVVQIVGDGANGRWLTWRWADPEWLAQECPSFPRSRGVHEVDGVEGLATRLAEALPTSDEDLRLDGPLTSPDGEHSLMQALSEALIPPDLRAQLLACHRKGTPVHIRVMPSPPVAAVPWGLLPIDGPNLRLLDLADVSWIGPILPRDVAPDPGPSPAWQQVQDVPSLHVLDPLTRNGAVLDTDVQLCTCHGASGRVVRDKCFSWDDLSTALAAGASRLLLVGHCIPGASAEDTAFVFSDPKPSNADMLSRRWNKGALHASDLLRSRLYSGPERRSGRELWPIPPRAGVVACASGVDLSAREPFGFATALLINGAETVHATLWALPTDKSLLTKDSEADGAFPELVQAIDHAQSADDPIAAICDWQRSRLESWRAKPSLRTSPVLWGSVMTLTAPNRRGS